MQVGRRFVVADVQPVGHSSDHVEAVRRWDNKEIVRQERQRAVKDKLLYRTRPDWLSVDAYSVSRCGGTSLQLRTRTGLIKHKVAMSLRHSILNEQ